MIKFRDNNNNNKLNITHTKNDSNLNMINLSNIYFKFGDYYNNILHIQGLKLQSYSARKKLQGVGIQSSI